MYKIHAKNHKNTRVFEGKITNYKLCLQRTNMPRKCCVPACKSNYQSARKEDNKCVTTFLFPKDEKRRAEWIRAIPRKDWTPSVSAVVCSNHFSDSEVIRYDKHLQPDGSFKQLLLCRPKLTETAVPSVYPNLPSYLNTKEVMNRSDPEERRSNISKRHSEVVNNFLKGDFFNTFERLKNEYTQKVNIFNWEVKILNNKIYFYTLNEERFFSIESSILIHDEQQQCS